MSNNNLRQAPIQTTEERVVELIETLSSWEPRLQYEFFNGFIRAFLEMRQSVQRQMEVETQYRREMEKEVVEQNANLAECAREFAQSFSKVDVSPKSYRNAELR